MRHMVRKGGEGGGRQAHCPILNAASRVSGVTMTSIGAHGGGLARDICAGVAKPGVGCVRAAGHTPGLKTEDKNHMCT